MRLGFGARAAGIGGALPAGARGIDAAWYNPAGLGYQSSHEIGGSYQSLVLDINQGTLGYARPLSERWGAALFVSYLDYGSQDRVTASTAGAFTTLTRTGASFKAHDLAGGIALGGRLSERIAAGIALKGISSRLDNAEAAAFAADAGLEASLGTRIPILVGLTARNIGTKMQFDSAKENLPLTVDFGARASLWDDGLALHAAGEWTRHERIVFRGGAEVRPFGPILTFRVGYDGANQAGSGLTAGLGFRHQEIGLDYAYAPFGKFGDNHRVGLTYRFGD